MKIIEYCKNSKYLSLKCLSVHIGSQILNYKPYIKMLKVLTKTLNQIDYKFDFIDLGGGMGITYNKNNKKLNYKKYNYAIKNF